MAKYFMYCRKSSEAEDRQILSIDSQIAELRKYAKGKGIGIHEVLTEAKSAKAPGRPVFNELMQRIHKGEADGILCWKLDRLARNPVDGGSIIWAMKEHDLKIVTPFQSYGQTEDNVVWMYIEFGMAQKYVDDLSKNVKRGLRARASMGYLPGQAPLGYNNVVNPDGRKVIVIDKETFPLVRRIFDLMLTGSYKPIEVARIINMAYGAKSRSGKFFGRSTIYTMLSNPFYHGVYEYPKGSGSWHTGRHTPVVTQEEFDLVQAHLNRGRRIPLNRKVFAFTGLMRCGGCGGAVCAEEKAYLTCSSCKTKFARRSRKACPSCGIPIEQMVNPKYREYCYYHCTRRNSSCKERSIELVDLLRQIVGLLKKVNIPELHRQWMDEYMKREGGFLGTPEVLNTIIQSFSNCSIRDQREVVMAIFESLTLRGGIISCTTKLPFSILREGQVITHLYEEAFGLQTLKQEVA